MKKAKINFSETSDQTQTHRNIMLSQSVISEFSIILDIFSKNIVVKGSIY